MLLFSNQKIIEEYTFSLEAHYFLKETQNLVPLSSFSKFQSLIFVRMLSITRHSRFYNLISISKASYEVELSALVLNFESVVDSIYSIFLGPNVLIRFLEFSGRGVS